jgi:hypothetical protein
MRTVIALVCAVAASGCNPFGPSCLGRQKRGTVASFAGEVGAGQIVSRVVPYGTEGSQNDVAIAWLGRSTGEGPRITVYATRVACTDFTPPGTGPCAPIGTRGGTQSTVDPRDIVQNSLTVTNGRGNPDILGTPAEYKLWIVGDPNVSVRYTIDITWFFGPDC